VRANGDARRDLEELDGILPRQVDGDRADHPLAPQQRIGHRRDVRHVDATEHQRPALLEGLQGQRHERPHGRENDGAVERLCRQLLGRTDPAGTELAREPLRRPQRPGEPVHSARLHRIHARRRLCRIRHRRRRLRVPHSPAILRRGGGSPDVRRAHRLPRVEARQRCAQARHLRLRRRRAHRRQLAVYHEQEVYAFTRAGDARAR
jgi:hypothetical protein